MHWQSEGQVEKEGKRKIANRVFNRPPSLLEVQKE